MDNYKAKVNKFSKRVKQTDKAIDPMVKQKIQKYRKTIDKIDSKDKEDMKPAEYREMMKTRNELMKQLNTLIEENTEKDEVIINTTVDGKPDIIKITEDEYQELASETPDPLLSQELKNSDS
jgi:hypothetical protein